jgi:transcriptional regulator with XRE-family HTH domain
MNERLTLFLKAEQLSPAQFADLMGIQRSGVSHILAQRNKPGFDFFATFLQKFPTVNIEWLISGRGKMYKDMETKQLFPDLSAPSEPGTAAQPDAPVITPSAPTAVTENPEPAAAPASAPESRCIEKLVILYNDGTFSEFVKP